MFSFQQDIQGFAPVLRKMYYIIPAQKISEDLTVDQFIVNNEDVSPKAYIFPVILHITDSSS